MTEIQPGTRVVLAAVVPAHGDENAPLLASVVAQIEQMGGQIVGRVIQRHGVSRGKNPGGASAMKRAAPLNLRTVLGTGKADELAELVRETRAELVVFCNPLTPTQRRALEELIGVEVRQMICDTDVGTGLFDMG